MRGPTLDQLSGAVLGFRGVEERERSNTADSGFRIAEGLTELWVANAPDLALFRRCLNPELSLSDVELPNVWLISGDGFLLPWLEVHVDFALSRDGNPLHRGAD